MAVMNAVAERSRPALIFNVPNDGCIDVLAADDVVEVPCMVDGHDARFR